MLHLSYPCNFGSGNCNNSQKNLPQGYATAQPIHPNFTLLPLSTPKLVLQLKVSNPHLIAFHTPTLYPSLNPLRHKHPSSFSYFPEITNFQRVPSQLQIIFFIIEEPFIVEPFKLFMETQTSGCWPSPPQSTPSNPGH